VTPSAADLPAGSPAAVSCGSIGECPIRPNESGRGWQRYILPGSVDSVRIRKSRLVDRNPQSSSPRTIVQVFFDLVEDALIQSQQESVELDRRHPIQRFESGPGFHIAGFPIPFFVVSIGGRL
jgi:hypothetical protein